MTNKEKTYAIIKSGGKQYRVAKDAVIDVELLDAEVGAEIEFAEVLFVNDGSHSHVGSPSVSKFVVTGELIGNAAGPKISSIKYKPNHNSSKKFGHRQHYSRVKIKDVTARK